ncbi:MAG: hypothetical protein SAJ12_14820 [Jaaginema sp. PMC 1079.18]|nr:hypothetical protein [Jaaginema sp. PMC 1080.18]MEC4852258.1 hypothetical protein [Jaaginema sp. PMC 1079.18]MEC4865814.1 hypothetical protein [Jaaginema sp. PMC 1078.18]
MKDNRKSLIILLPIIILSFLSIKAEAYAQSRSSEDIQAFTDRVYTRFTDNCSKTIELTYKSQTLTSPDRNKSIYFETIVRNIGDRNYNGSSACVIESGQTPVAKIVISSGSNQRAENFISLVGNQYNLANKAAILTPVSWSANSRYVIVRVDYVLGYDFLTDHLILDSQNNYRQINLGSNNIPCANAGAGGELLGFTSSTVVAFSCGEFGDPGYIEVVNLGNRSISRVNNLGNISRLQTYGMITSNHSIRKIQEFPGR